MARSMELKHMFTNIKKGKSIYSCLLAWNQISY